MNKEKIKKEIIDLYKEAREDGTNWYLSYYCASQEDEKKRLETDAELIAYFINLVNSLT